MDAIPDAAIYLVGMVEDPEGHRAADSETTRAQVAAVRGFALDVIGPDGGPVAWIDIDDPDEPRTFLQSIVRDRLIRVDRRTFMADRPKFAALTVAGDRVVRVEYYEGHDALALRFDLRAAEYVDEPLQPFYGGA